MVSANVLPTTNLDMQEICTAEMIDNFLVVSMWDICSTYHIVLKSLSDAAVFDRDLLSAIPYIADWTVIG